jgi:predicted enzyme involved in methoxymalonyl-ACP biosynthesis
MDDKHGSHGEVIACLVDPKGCIKSFVMSCRVFQRRLEYAFMCWIISHLGHDTISMEFAETKKNEPFRKFLESDAFSKGNDLLVHVSAASFTSEFFSTMDLFGISQP